MDGCRVCNCFNPAISNREIVNALTSENPLKEIGKILIESKERSCKVITTRGSDHFEQKEECDIAARIDRFARGILENKTSKSKILAGMKITYKPGDCQFFYLLF